MSARGKAPHNVSVLQRWIAERGRAQGVAPARLQRWVSFMVIASMLDRARTDTGEAIFILKGGVAIELRFALRARSTRDYDAVFRSERTQALARLDDALRAGNAGFTATRSAMEPIGPTDANRVDVSLAYRGRPWSTIPLELAADELHTLARIPCLPVSFQIAQKLHAVSATVAGVRNDRFRDLLDLQLLVTLVHDDLAAVRDACVTVFEQRAQHAWPPTLVIQDHWADQYARLAEITSFPIADVDLAAEAVRQFISEIEAAGGV